MTIELNNNVYTDGGNDTETTPVVLVHGFPVDHRMWDECAAALRDQAVKQGVKPFAIWAPDMPGAGEGPIPIYRKFGRVFKGVSDEATSIMLFRQKAM